jgi:undecaprenyl-diphosphatase
MLRRMTLFWKWLRIARTEITSLLIVLLLGAAVFAFAEIAEEMREGETLSFDRAVLLALRDPQNLSDPIGPMWLEAAVADITSLGGKAVLTIIVLIVSGFLFLNAKHGAAALVLVSSGGGSLLTFVLKSLFDRPRPDVVVHLVGVSSASFPSGHAMASATIYLTLGALLARVQPQGRLKVYSGVVAATLTVLVGLSRVYLGVHWPTDVLAGWCIGAAWAMLCWLVAGWLQRRGAVEGTPPTDVVAK